MTGKTGIACPGDGGIVTSVALRPSTTGDLDCFFAHQQDAAACWMAAFTAADPADKLAFLARWRRIAADETIVLRTILADGAVAGNVLKLVAPWGTPEVSYWLGRPFWGQGIATQALRLLLLTEVTERPLFGRAASDNLGSIRVMEKCGFERCATGRAFANARGAEVDEVVLRLG